MNRKEIEEGIKNIHWYYYYNFDGVEVNKKKKNDKTLGIYNWNKLKPIMKEIFAKVDNPHVLNIGCNMGLYDHEMTKMGAKVTAVDRNIENIEFYKKYITENRKEDWKVDIKKMDMSYDRFKDDTVNIILMFCVIYHLGEPINQNNIVSNFSVDFPNHRFLVLQGNIPRVVKNNMPEAGVEGMRSILQNSFYSVPEYYIYEWDGYQKPIVIGER